MKNSVEMIVFFLDTCISISKNRLFFTSADFYVNCSYFRMILVVKIRYETFETFKFEFYTCFSLLCFANGVLRVPNHAICNDVATLNCHLHGIDVQKEQFEQYFE